MPTDNSHPKNDRKEVFGWIMYDWANSAFYTTVVSVLVGPYLTALAQADVGRGGVVLGLGPFGSITSDNLFPATLGFSVFIQIFLLPVLGSIADYTNLKKRLMAAFCYTGVMASCLLFFISGDSYLWGCALLMVANISFAAANVFYNAFLIDITTEDKRDRVSSHGYALGYFGGVIMLLLNLGLISNASTLGMSEGLAVRISMLSASLWWGVFAIVTFKLIKNRGAIKENVPKRKLVTVGFKEVFKTLRELYGLRYTCLFLIAYLFYNDGIQTVILNSSVFLSQELFVARGLEISQSFLLGIFVVAQVAALFGSLIFEWISRFLGTKRTILVCVAIWCCIVIHAYAFLQSTAQAFVMAIFIGLVLGSTQALSRSLYSQMIPKERESAFFGLYEISEKGTSWVGNLVFAVVVGTTGSFRHAILALIVFFVVGFVILLFTNTTKAIHAAGNLTPEEAASK
ncbi:MAG TPA: MFS transporter [Pyrinomonadaceae bacterium]|nr:MFS transporter [Pyrinomonadaceae bacterium]HMP64951.1 MFS transporter [Pyrinomonadaceae bacterium]